MKLFTRTLLFFVGVIIFGAGLTALLMTNLTRRINQADARRELGAEATLIYDGFNSWKRQLWISLVGIGSEPRLARVLSVSHGHLPREDFSAALRDVIFVSKIDDLVLRDPDTGALDILPVSYSTFSATDLQSLNDTQQYPHLELRMIRDVLCMVGVTGIQLSSGEHVDVFLLKRIDTEFCNQLTLNRPCRVAVFAGTRYLVGSFPHEPPALIFDPLEMNTAYREAYGQRVGAGRMNAAYQRLGRLGRTEQGEELFLGVFLSNERYAERILLVSRAVLLVSAAAAALSIGMALYFSRRITSPVAHLLAGMERMKSGAYDTRLQPGGGYEISRLVAGFNEMAGEVQQNRAAMLEYLHETVVLKEYNEKIINSIKAAIAIVGREMVIEKANPAFLQGFGLQDRPVIGVSLQTLGIELLDPSVLEGIRSVLARKLESFSQTKRTGNGRIVDIRLYPFYSLEESTSGCVFMADDITAKVELEHQIFRTEKLSSISMLSAGMAHEINNPLGSILTNVQNLLAEETGAERRVSLGWIEQETLRIARIVRQLLDFASADSAHAPGSDLNHAVKEVIELLSYSVKPEGRVRIDTRLAGGLPPSAVSTDELKQVIINLITNSIQAIGGEGRVLIGTGMGRDGKLRLSVADTGTGMAEGTAARIFDPFFTTKTSGTGLGLSVVYGIVTKYNGTISVRSAEGRGTRIRLGFPLLESGA